MELKFSKYFTNSEFQINFKTFSFRILLRSLTQLFRNILVHFLYLIQLDFSR